MFVADDFHLAFVKAFWEKTKSNWYHFITKDSSESYQGIAVTDAKDLVIVITGSNTGLGRAAAEELVEQGATVILACRNMEKAEEVAKTINTNEKVIANHGKAVPLYLDLEDFSTIPQFVEKLKLSFTHIDVLINNAGYNKEDIFPTTKLQTLFQVNYLGHYFLFQSMLQLLQHRHDGKTEPAKVINISSVTHHVGQTNFLRAAYGEYTDEMIKKSSYYADSKFYLNLLTMEINQRYSHSDQETIRPILSLSVHPGAVKSDIWRNSSYKWLWDIFMDYYFLNVHQGCQPILAAVNFTEKMMNDYQAKYIMNAKKGGRFIFHPLIPYYVPYKIEKLELWEEILGDYVVPHLSAVSVPEDPMISTKLWEFSSQLCGKLINTSE